MRSRGIKALASWPALSESRVVPALLSYLLVVHRGKHSPGVYARVSGAMVLFGFIGPALFVAASHPPFSYVTEFLLESVGPEGRGEALSHLLTEMMVFVPLAYAVFFSRRSIHRQREFHSEHHKRVERIESAYRAPVGIALLALMMANVLLAKENVWWSLLLISVVLVASSLAVRRAFPRTKHSETVRGPK